MRRAWPGAAMELRSALRACTNTASAFFGTLRKPGNSTKRVPDRVATIPQRTWPRPSAQARSENRGI